MKSIVKYIGILALAFTAVCCVKEKGDTLPPDTFRIDTDEYSVIALDQNAQVAFIPVVTNVPEDKWEFESNASWCSIGRSLTAEKGVMVSVSDNTDKEELRRAQVCVRAAGKEYLMSVVQTGYGPAIIVKDVSVGPEGGLVNLDIISNVQLNEALMQKPVFNAEDGDNWIRFHNLAVTKGFATTRLSFQVDVNELPDKREATVTLKAANSADSKADTKCVITQNSISVTSTEIFSDTKIPVISARANQVSSYEGSAEALVDGSYESYYHSPYEVETVFPVVWEFEFDGDSRIDYISIMHRASGGNAGAHWRGQIGQFNVYYKVNATDEYTFAQKFDFGGNGGYQTANLSSPIENATWVKIEILDGDPNSASYTDGTYITCAEVEFYNSNRSEVNDWITRIFTDLSCSKIREGVTKKDIVKMNAVSPYLATNVAMPLFNGTYDEGEKDFRIHDYEPYSDNRVNLALVSRIYSAMDNPTGIEVKAGKDIIVCVDLIPEGQSVSLAVYGDRADGQGPNYGGGGSNEGYDQNTTLIAGVNTVRIQADGMAYVLNTVTQKDPRNPDTTPISSYKSVKVHILPGCGTVQGYYDPARHNEARYKELLNRCTYKYFMVKGKKILFLFHTNQLRSDFPNSIDSGVKAWDDILSWQHELMGLDKKPWFNNHMTAVTSTNPDVYMDASHRRVQFNAGTIAKIGSREALIANECGWGPSHEMGHTNQQAINWCSTTESSNNLFSNYCMMKLAGDQYYKTINSRGKRITDLASDYAASRPWVLLGDGSYQGEDPELHMRMNWQLWNYFHNCNVQPDFFPRLFEHLRLHPLPGEMAVQLGRDKDDPGLAQLEYYEACCTVSGLDLTEFFDAWGFFIPIDQQYTQYYTVLYRVTDQMINASKARVRDMKLPKAPPIQYLEDRKDYCDMGHFDAFKAKEAVSGTPSASISGGKVTITGCENAIAVEVRRGNDSTGQLLYFANTFSFTSPVSLSGNSLWAVQYDGKRVRVNVQ